MSVRNRISRTLAALALSAIASFMFVLAPSDAAGPQQWSSLDPQSSPLDQRFDPLDPHHKVFAETARIYDKHRDPATGRLTETGERLLNGPSFRAALPSLTTPRPSKRSRVHLDRQSIKMAGNALLDAVAGKFNPLAFLPRVLLEPTQLGDGTITPNERERFDRRPEVNVQRFDFTDEGGMTIRGGSCSALEGESCKYMLMH